MINRSQKLFLTLCVLIFVIVGYGCDEPAPSPSVHDNYTVIEFSFDELIKLPAYAQEVLDGEGDYGVWRYHSYDEAVAFFEEYVGENAGDYLTQEVFEEHFIIACTRYGYNKTNYKYSNCKFVDNTSHMTIDRTVLNPDSSAEKGYWLDLVIVPTRTMSGEIYCPWMFLSGSIFSDEIMGE